MEEELDFKCILILIYLNQEKLHYNTYSIMKLLSVNYSTLEKLFSILIELNYIAEDSELFYYKITSSGKEFLYSKYMNNIDIRKVEYIRENGQKNNVVEKQIFYIPKDFKL